MTYEKIFADVRKVYSKADKKKLDDDFAFQFNITGEGEGIFYVAFRGGMLEVAPYDYVDKNATLYATGEDFIRLAHAKFTLEEALKEGYIHIDGDSELACVLNKLAGSSSDSPKKPKKEAAVKKPVSLKKPAAKITPPPPPEAPKIVSAETSVSAVKIIPGDETLV